MSRSARRRAALAAIAFACLASVAGGSATHAAPGEEAADATVTAPGDEVVWTGGPFQGPNPTACTDDTALVRAHVRGPMCCPDIGGTCDHFILEIAPAEQPVYLDVAIVGEPFNDLDLYIYRADGTYVTRSAGNAAHEAVKLLDPAPGRYDIRVTAVRTTPGATYEGRIRVLGEQTRNEVRHQHQVNCDGYLPGAFSVAGVTDAGRTVSLDVLVLLDGQYPVADAEHVFALASERSYEPLGVRLNPTFERAPFAADGVNDRNGVAVPTLEVNRMLENAYAHVGGFRPDQYDIVYVLTDKDLWLGESTPGDPATRQYAIGGMADCIGGVQSKSFGFAVGELVPRGFEESKFNGITFYFEGGAKLAAHEIGHLMGARHEYSNCVEGIPTELDEPEASPCTLMGINLRLNSFNFDSFSAGVVRGEAISHAAANDPSE